MRHVKIKELANFKLVGDVSETELRVLTVLTDSAFAVDQLKIVNGKRILVLINPNTEKSNIEVLESDTVNV